MKATRTTDAPTASAAPSARSRRLRRFAFAAVALIPLAFAGLYIASIGDTESGIDRIPAAIVNEDELVTVTNDDGTTQPVLAGRQLVTELTGDDSPGLDWQLSNAEEAKDALAKGEVYAVLTIPADFTKSVLSLQGDEPEQAELALQTDDAHSYLAGTVAQSAGDGMVRAFGAQITEQYISGLYSGLGGLGDALGQASDGAAQLADGAASAATGADKLAGGVSAYTSGVSKLSDGISSLNRGAGELDKLSAGVDGYTDNVAQVSAALTQAANALAADPTDPVALGTVQVLSGQLAQLSAGGDVLDAKTAAGIDKLQGGIAKLATGASKAAAGGPALASGASGLADGVGKLADGASDLSTGLASGVAQLPSSDAAAQDKAASVAAQPVDLTVSTENAVSQSSQMVATFLVPLGLWIGALAVFLVIRPVSRRLLGSTVASGRLLGSTLARAGAITAIQAALLVLLLHTAAGVAWTLLPATLVFSLLVAAAFTAFHHLLTIGLGRGGLVISLFLLALQLAAVPGLYPVELLTAPFAGLSPFLPLSWATTGLQQIVTGGDAGVAIGASVALLAFGLGSLAVSRLAIRRTRRARALGIVAASPLPAN